jgi:amino acid transporter
LFGKKERKMENMDMFLLIALVVLFIGVCLAGRGGICFRIRAVSNKRAWDGPVKPLLISGAVIMIIGIALVYFAYPLQ